MLTSPGITVGLTAVGGGASSEPAGAFDNLLIEQGLADDDFLIEQGLTDDAFALEQS